MNWLLEAAQAWGLVGAVLSLAMSLFAAVHAVLYKREARAATLWVGVIWLVPLVGALLYFLLGINRIKRRANLLRGSLESYRTKPAGAECAVTDLVDRLPPEQRHLRALAVATAKVLSRPLVTGNRIEVLVNGDAAYPAMLEAIDGARHSLTLSTYIFDRDDAGLAFARALGAAVRRGVEVRVLIDATGTRYSWPPILGELRRARVRYARFLPAFPLWRLMSLNLRNHRKILVADGRLGFTGGMNLRVGHWLSRQPAHPVQDLHFRVTGPVVAHLQEVFAEDWCFTTGEALRGDLWFPALAAEGAVIARGLADGPDEDFEKLRWTLLAALAAARESVRVATPYFLPEPGLITALNLAALRGVQVDILLPVKSNLPLVDWASTAQWWQVLERGCRLWLSPPPFDHSKLMVVDGTWSLVGSANWDPRSLRLNFEFNVEAYDPALAGALTDWFETRRRQSRPVSLAEVDGRRFPVRLRDGVARLFTPYL
ncbi:MAG: phospholipase D-like domain-containing protein [Verrucomicrobia bacterium]|nr:phospholipase D-like domain-containing protein [Verrucomicrobiota bacterium]